MALRNFRSFAWAMACLLAGIPGEAAGRARLPHRFPAANPAASSRFLPPAFDLDAAGLEKFRALAAAMRMDSTHHWEFRNGRLRISYDLMQALAGGGAAPIHIGRGLAARLASRGLALDPEEAAHAAYLPDDPLVAGDGQWAIRNSGASRGGRPGTAGLDVGIEKVWDRFSGADSLVIAVLDAGFDFTHPDLKGINWINRAEADGLPGVDDDGNGYVDDSVGWDFVGNDNDPQDRHGHGTMMSSVIAAGFDNHLGVAGMLPHARIMPVRVLDASGHGDLSGIAEGILYAVRNGAKAINFSIGSGADSRAMRAAFQAAQTAGVPIIVAAGNDAVDLDAHPAYPAAYTFDNLIVVAAHDHAGQLCAFSNYGRTVADLAAPGEFVAACNIHDPILAWGDFFETETLGWDTTGAWRLSKTDPLDPAQSLEWIAGDSATLTAKDTLDLRGVDGGVLQFLAYFHGADTSDAIIVEGNRIGSPDWTTLAVVWGTVDPATTLSVGLQDMDGSRFRLRFRAVNNPRFSAAKRVFKLDAVMLRTPDPNPPQEPAYLREISGTSIAAPFVAAYVGMLRLACDRMGVAYSRSRALAGVDTEAALAGKVSTGGRLDIYKGLRFYLETLPELQVEDSTQTEWKAGQRMEYSLSIDPAPAQAYAFSVLGLPDGTGIDGAGKLVWTPAEAQAGQYTLRFKAEGPTTLRKMLQVKIESLAPVPLAHVPSPAGWEIGGLRYRLPPGTESGRHLVEIAAVDAAGRTATVFRGWVESPASRRAPVGRGPGLEVFRTWRISVDGMPLRAER